MPQIEKNATLFLRFLNLVRAIEGVHGLPQLDATEEKLLQRLAVSWGRDKPVTVLETMGMEADVSATTIHRRLKSLSKKGVIRLEMDEADNRVKYVVPTTLANEYFAKLSACMAAAAKSYES